MRAKKIWANFSVKDVKRTHQFYTKLGFTPNTVNDYPKLASFLFGDDDFVVHFFEEQSFNQLKNSFSALNEKLLTYS